MNGMFVVYGSREVVFPPSLACFLSFFLSFFLSVFYIYTFLSNTCRL